MILKKKIVIIKKIIEIITVQRKSYEGAIIRIYFYPSGKQIYTCDVYSVQRDKFLK